MKSQFYLQDTHHALEEKLVVMDPEVRGLNRLHQFDKVEIVRLEHPDNSSQALLNMKEHIKEILDELEIDLCVIYVQVILDLHHLKHMILRYFQKDKKWLEISSVSNFKSYQSKPFKP